MLTLILALTAHADTPTEAALTEEAAEEEEAAPVKREPINIGPIVLTGEIAVPDVVVFTPRVTTQESSSEALDALIDDRIAEAAARK